MSTKNWKLYVLQCADDSLYTGITTDLDRRLQEHNESPRGARYTRSRRPVKLVASWSCENHSRAAQAEYAFKQLRRKQKLNWLDADVSQIRALIDD